MPGPFHVVMLATNALDEIRREVWNDARRAGHKLARTVTEQRAGITAAIRHRLSNARVEAISTQIRLLTRRAFRLPHLPDALIAVAMLSLADLCAPLPR